MTVQEITVAYLGGILLDDVPIERSWKSQIQLLLYGELSST